MKLSGSGEQNNNPCIVLRGSVVNCTLKPWSEWSDCSEACDTGTQTRKRDIQQNGLKRWYTMPFGIQFSTHTNPKLQHTAMPLEEMSNLNLTGRSLWNSTKLSEMRKRCNTTKECAGVKMVTTM